MREYWIKLLRDDRSPWAMLKVFATDKAGAEAVALALSGGRAFLVHQVVKSRQSARSRRKT